LVLRNAAEFLGRGPSATAALHLQIVDDIIDKFYVDMREHSPPSGRVFTYLLTLAAREGRRDARRAGDLAHRCTELEPWRHDSTRTRYGTLRVVAIRTDADGEPVLLVDVA
jgi:hypothetical protein